jgi:predicted adenine nucleotide alpha hydrolase (AANH) superfamily ATPase
VAALGEEHITPCLFWYNPNIHPYIEYCSRRDTLKQYAGEEGLALVMEDQYGLRVFLDGLYGSSGVACTEGASPEAVSGEACKSGAFPEPAFRCAFCYHLRLERTAARAAAEGYDAFSTTLLISPYQNHECIRAAAEELAVRYGVDFLYRDFRPRFRAGQTEARARGFYMQKYCGCIFSEEESMTHRKKAKLPASV